MFDWLKLIFLVVSEIAKMLLLTSSMLIVLVTSSSADQLLGSTNEKTEQLMNANDGENYNHFETARFQELPGIGDHQHQEDSQLELNPEKSRSSKAIEFNNYRPGNKSPIQSFAKNIFSPPKKRNHHPSSHNPYSKNGNENSYNSYVAPTNTNYNSNYGSYNSYATNNNTNTNYGSSSSYIASTTTNYNSNYGSYNNYATNNNNNGNNYNNNADETETTEESKPAETTTSSTTTLSSSYGKTPSDDDNDDDEEKKLLIYGIIAYIFFLIICQGVAYAAYYAATQYIPYYLKPGVPGAPGAPPLGIFGKRSIDDDWNQNLDTFTHNVYDSISQFKRRL
jgi:hypothetical protein